MKMNRIFYAGNVQKEAVLELIPKESQLLEEHENQLYYLDGKLEEVKKILDPIFSIRTIPYGGSEEKYKGQDVPFIQLQVKKPISEAPTLKEETSPISPVETPVSNEDVRIFFVGITKEDVLAVAKRMGSKEELLIEHDGQLYYRKNKLNQLKLQLLPYFKVTDMKYRGNEEEYQNTIVPLIQLCSDNLERVLQLKKNISYMNKDKIALFLKAIRNNQSQDKTQFQLLLYQLLEFIPKLDELFDADEENIAIATELIEKEETISKNITNLTEEFARWTLLG